MRERLKQRLEKNSVVWWRTSGAMLLAVFFLWRAWLYTVSAWIYTLPRPELNRYYLAFHEFGNHTLPQWLEAWSNFDGMVFLRIASRGYETQELPFFPLLPLLLAGLQRLTGWQLTVLATLTSLVVFPVGLWLASKLYKIDAPRRSMVWFLLVVITFPTAHYFTATYQDALFFTLATATVWWARRKQWLFASLSAAAASLARLNGLALLVFLGAEYWLECAPQLEKSWNLKTLWLSLPKLWTPNTWFSSRRYIWFFLLVPLPFLAYLGWINQVFGDWNLFFEGAEVWHRDQAVFPLRTFWRYAKILTLTVSVSLVYFVAVIEAGFTALYGWILAQQWGKLRLSYWLWMLAHLSIPVVTGTLQGMPRYGLHLYPMFFVLALWTDRWPRWAKVLYVLAGLAGQVWLSIWFLRGYFVA